MKNVSLHNTLTGKKAPFIPMEDQNVRMYVCGPTVYDRAHLGNARAMVVFDQLFRTLGHRYGQSHVTYVRNITDVDDKINAAALVEKISISELTTRTTKKFHEDLSALGCIPPTHEPRATAHIAQMLAMIETLIDQDKAYEAEGHVLFRVQKDPKYGHLSGRTVEEMVAGARIEVAPYKEYAGDFVLWKPSSQNEPGWESPYGYGRPGWHIECSAMSTHYLGETFDIHGGGADLKFPHHENEIAQSCGAHPGSAYANIWVHNGFLTVDGEKMSKSLGNFITAQDLLTQPGMKGEVIRVALLSSHYRKPLNWSKKLVVDAFKALDYAYGALAKAGYVYPQSNGTNACAVPDSIQNALYDDLNTSNALTALHKLAAVVYQCSDDPAAQQQAAADLYVAGRLLGLFSDTPDDWFDQAPDPEIEALLVDRKAARESKDWAKADAIRDQLTANNIEVQDNPDGSSSWRRIL